MTPRIATLFFAVTLAWPAALPAQDAPAAGSASPDSASQPAVNTSTNAIVAVVNDKIITVAQVEKQIDPVKPTIYANANANFPDTPEGEAGARKYVQDQVTRLFKEILDNMVDNILMVQAFNDAGYAIPKSYMDQIFDESMVNRFNGDREQFLQYLQANHLTERQYRQQLQDDQIVGYMKQKQQDTVNAISPDRIVKYYDLHKDQWKQEAAVKIRQITLKLGTLETMGLLMQQGQEIVQQARAPGANFAELAGHYSQDEFKNDGGEVGWVERDKYQKPMEDAIFALKPGEVSNPVALGDSVYIFKCEDKRAAGIQTVEQVHMQIESALLILDTREAEAKWLKKLRKNAYIKYNIPGMEADAN
jgi:peptidyl-prolyl cis-trans isomerase SurA